MENGNTPEDMCFKKKAHAFTLLSAIWVFFSLFGLFFWMEYFKRNSTTFDLVAACVLWGLHILFISLAVHFWRHEKPIPYE